MKSRLAKWVGTLSSLVGFSLAPAMPVRAQTLAPGEAPMSWVRYAEVAMTGVKTWLQADSEQALRLRTYLDATRPAPDQPTAPLMLKLWIDDAGRVSRIDCPAFAHPEANADMQALLVGQSLPAKPPKDMLLPLRIMVQLDPAILKAMPTDEAELIDVRAALPIG